MKKIFFYAVGGFFLFCSVGYAKSVKVNFKNIFPGAAIMQINCDNGTIDRQKAIGDNLSRGDSVIHKLQGVSKCNGHENINDVGICLSSYTHPTCNIFLQGISGRNGDKYSEANFKLVDTKGVISISKIDGSGIDLAPAFNSTDRHPIYNIE